ncbi:hypothetical protein [Catenulispora pinisilvae]|uniref:hypothetical protein n=1 Tax=Catenulispora pinisilvae TaxID=2705253 RepID=UPI001891D3E8|nr:hypothetical protein [Catenulispora pinisilvae]
MTGLSAARRRELAYELSVLASYMPPGSPAARHAHLAHGALTEGRITAAREHLRRAIEADARSLDVAHRRRMAEVDTALTAAFGPLTTP